MPTNQDKPAGPRGGTPEQHAAAGRQSHKNDNRSQQSGSPGSGSGGTQDRSKQSGSSESGTGTGTRGGTPEQHAEARRQSHKNDDKGNR